MKKILYVEDAPKIDTIRRLFRKLLSDDEKFQLKKLNYESVIDDNNIQAIEPKDIAEILKNNPVVELQYDFSEALRVVSESHEDYDLFIIDRDLSEYPYNREQVGKLDKNYTPGKYETYEGVYLIETLYYKINKREDITQKVFFFSGNPPENLVHNNRGLKEALECLKKENFIEKSSEPSMEWLINIINNSEQRLIWRSIREPLGYLSDIIPSGNSKELYKNAIIETLAINAPTDCQRHLEEFKDILNFIVKSQMPSKIEKQLKSLTEVKIATGRREKLAKWVFPNVDMYMTFINKCRISFAHMLADQTNRPQYARPSSYSLKAMAYVILELLEWFRTKKAFK